MPPWNRREFVALGVGTITAAITQNFRAATASNSKIRAAVLGIEHAHAAGKTKVTQDRDRQQPRDVKDFQEMAQVVRRQRRASYSSENDLMAQEKLLRSCGVCEDENANGQRRASQMLWILLYPLDQSTR